MNQPKISNLDPWSNHERRVKEVLCLALKFLQDKNLSSANEDNLNKELYFCLLEANQELKSKNRGFDHPPTAEGINPPDIDDALNAKRRWKRPDFYWGYIDHLESDPERCARHFYIECKRLGKPIPTGILTSLYVQKGIRRFITEEHGYAKSERSGAMVGYIQNMKLPDILQEVNNAARKCPDPVKPLQLSSNGWQPKGVTELTHDLDRTFPITPFRLHHFWLDIR